MRALLLIGLLAGCSVAEEVATQTARDTAKDVVNGVVLDRFPGVNPAPVTNCIIDNASTDEIFSLAKAAVLGVDETTVDTVVDITKRQDTVVCIARNGLNLFGI